MLSSCRDKQKANCDLVLTTVAFALTCTLLLVMLGVVPALYATLRSSLRRLRSLKRAMRELSANNTPPLTTLLEERAMKPKPTLLCNRDGQVWLPIASKVANGWRLRRRLLLMTPSLTPDAKEAAVVDTAALKNTSTSSEYNSQNEARQDREQQAM